MSLEQSINWPLLWLTGHKVGRDQGLHMPTSTYGGGSSEPDALLGVVEGFS
jgi:hypothetical protein